MSKQQNYVPLSDQAKAIILGSLLGDGSLQVQNKYRHARFQMRHSVQQAEYFYWKVSALKEIAGSKSVQYQKKDGYSTRNKLRFGSRALPALTDLYQLTYTRRVLRIRRKWLNQMTALSLTIWWCDDGSLISNSRKGVFCTDSFEKNAVKILARYFDKVWGVKTIVAPVGQKRNGRYRQYWRLWIRSTSELQKFLRIILPQISVASMLPKVLLLYRDSRLQQRWISEVVQLTGFPKPIVEKYVSEKRMKWKRFR